MKPIDCDKTGPLFIQKPSAQPRSVSAQMNTGELLSYKTSTHQISDLVRLVQSCTDTIGDSERINQIKREINANVYTVDFDALTENILTELLHAPMQA